MVLTHGAPQVPEVIQRVLARMDGGVQPGAGRDVRVRLERHRLERVVGGDVFEDLLLSERLRT